MRIVLSHHAFRMQSFGGVSRYASELARSLRELGVDVTSPAYLHSNSFARDESRGVFVGEVGPRRVRQGLTLAADTFLEWASPSRRRSDVYHYTYYPRWHVPAGGMTAVTVYDMIHERFPADFASSDHTPRVKRSLCRSAEVIFAISESTKRDLVDILDVDPERVTVTSLGPTEVAPRARTEASRGALLYVGDRSRRYKNFAVVIRALAAPNLRDVRLVCVGGGELTAAERAELKGLDLEDRVEARGATDDELATLYSEVTALVVPSLWEGFGLPLVEAMRQGCPVVCSRTDPCVEVTADAAETFDPTSVDELASVLGRVMADAALRAEMSAKGRRRAEGFSWEACARKTLDGYRRAGAV